VGRLLSAAVLVVAVLLRWALDPLLGDSLALITLFGAVAAAAWLSGHLTAIAVALLGYVACAYLFIEPRGRLGLDVPANAVGLGAYLFTCALIVGFGEAMRRAQARVGEQRELLRVTLHSIGDAVIATDVEGRVTFVNPVAEELTGWSSAEARGRPLDAVFHILNEATRQPVPNPATRALRDGVVVGLANHTVLVRRDGSDSPIDDSAAPIRDERGVVSGCVLVFRDVTAQRAAERDRVAQLAAARFLAAIVESSEVAIVSKSLDGVIQSWNAAAERLFGHSAEQAIGRHISLVIPPERIAEEDEIIASLRAGRRVEHFETERVRADGGRVQVSLTISPIRDDAGRVIGASKMVRDITRERLAEAERAKFVTVIENSRDFIGICDLDGRPSFVNRAGLDLVGLDDLEAARRVAVRDFFFPEDQARMMDEFFPSVLARGHGDVEVRFRHFRTGAARWMAYKVLTLHDDRGRPVAFATVSQDVTERKRLEDDLRQLAASLSEADRRKDEFLAMLAHELRGPLAPLANVLELWKLASDPETLQRARATMERQLGQLVRLVDDLLDLNRIMHNRLELRRSRVELSGVIQHAVEACRPFAASLGHDLCVALPVEAWHVHADPARLAQVFGNLLHNACKYTPRGGEIAVAAERHGGEVEVTVRDNGAGIPPDKLDSIFEMFTQVDGSLERAQGGLGIGLTLVKRLVEMHGGTVVARSAGSGHGSEFAVRLPLAVAVVESAGAAEADVPPRVRSRRILVVDDNVDSATTLAALLRLDGHVIFTAHDGESAMDAAELHRPDVVLLDIGLPLLNGHDVCRRLRQQSWGKELLLVALTGWGHDQDRRKSREAGFDAHLVKPVDRGALLRLLAAREQVEGTT